MPSVIWEEVQSCEVSNTPCCNEIWDQIKKYTHKASFDIYLNMFYK